MSILDKEKIIEEQLNKICTSSYSLTHLTRYKQTLKYIIPHITNNMSILDVGGEGDLIKTVLNSVFTNINVENTDCDLRYDFITKLQEYDLIISLEVIEHIKDRDSPCIELISTQYNSGIWNFFINCNRLLKKDGILFLTTPNVNSIVSICSSLEYYHPCIYKPHPKELSLQEIFTYCNKCDFNIITYDTFNVWNTTISNTNLMDDIIKVLKKYNLQKYRNEDTFIICKKNEDIKNKDLNVEYNLNYILKSIDKKLTIVKHN